MLKCRKADIQAIPRSGTAARRFYSPLCRLAEPVGQISIIIRLLSFSCGMSPSPLAASMTETDHVGAIQS